MFETETVGPFLVWELKWGVGHIPLASPVATPLGYPRRIAVLGNKCSSQKHASWSLVTNLTKLY